MFAEQITGGENKNEVAEMQPEHIVIITVVESNVFYEFKYLWNKLLVNTGFGK